MKHVSPNVIPWNFLNLLHKKNPATRKVPDRTYFNDQRYQDLQDLNALNFFMFSHKLLLRLLWLLILYTSVRNTFKQDETV